MKIVIHHGRKTNTLISRQMVLFSLFPFFFSFLFLVHQKTSYSHKDFFKCCLLDGLLWSDVEIEPGPQEHLLGSKVLCKEPKRRSSDVWDATDMFPGLPQDIAADAAAPGARIERRKKKREKKKKKERKESYGEYS